MKTAISIIAVVFILIFGGLAIKIVFFPMNTIEQSVDMAYGVVNETLDSKNVIYTYEWFKQQEADIRKCIENENIAQTEYDEYLAGLPSDKTVWGDFEKQEESSLRNSLSALKKLTNKAIEDYNAKASMVNKNIFKDNLPSNITRAFYAGMELTK